MSALEVPDPDLLRHAHVALPAAEVAPEWTHPRTGEPFAVVAARLVAALPRGKAGRAAWTWHCVDPGRRKDKGPWIAPQAFSRINSPATTYSPTHLSHAVPSALRGLTAVFGMGTGVSPSPQPPGKLEY